MIEPLEKIGCLITTMSLLIVPLTIQSVRPSNVEEKDACNKAINWTYLYQQFIDKQMEASKSFLVIKHAKLFLPPGQHFSETNIQTPSILQEGHEDSATRDINDLLARIWNLESNNIRVLYPAPIQIGRAHV